LVGNDVVDLDDPVIGASHLRERFLARVLSPTEREHLASVTETKRYVWSLFAAKEAAYKVIAKRTVAPPAFAHRRFEVAHDFSSVSYGGLVMRLRLDETRGGFVHAVAWTGLVAPISDVAELEATEDPSLGVRSRLLSALGGDAELSVVREPRPASWDGFGPPRVLCGGRPVGLDVSLSHDGCFVAWAAVPVPALGAAAAARERVAARGRGGAHGRVLAGV
jgi:phosphopantetheinyl transferase (holo-ACP synthase)